VGSIFKRLAPMLKMYGDYVNNYEEIVRNLDTLRKKNTYPPLEKVIQVLLSSANPYQSIYSKPFPL